MSGAIGHRMSAKQVASRTGRTGRVALAASAAVLAAAFAAAPACLAADSGSPGGQGVPPAVNPGGQEWFRDGAGQQPARIDEPGQPATATPTAPATPNGTPPQPPRNQYGGWQWSPPNYGTPGGYGGAAAGYPYGYAGWPTYEMNNFVAAQVRAVTARALFSRAESELGQAFRAAQRLFESSPEYRAALRDEQQAYDGLNDVRRRAVRRLVDDPKYQRLLALKQDLADQLEQRRAARDITPAEVLSMATLKMSYAVELRSMEGTALNNESGVKEAQDRLVGAGSKLADMRARHDDAVRTNPEIMAARRNLEDARIGKLTAEAFLRATLRVGDEALDYAYWSNNRHGGGSRSYGYGGYGYAGYGGGY